MAKGIIDKHFKAASVPALDKNVLPTDIPFFTKQMQIVLADSGAIDPEKIEPYVARGGYTALAHALREMSPEEVCSEMTKSGLRGRDGSQSPWRKEVCGRQW